MRAFRYTVHRWTRVFVLLSLGIMLAACAPSTIVVTTPSPIVSAPAFGCGELGNACCRPPDSVSASTLGPLVACGPGLGCDINTDTCVQPCGGPGQACCDGPETRALKWTEDGRVYSPNPPLGIGGGIGQLREMCTTGACDTQTHRCFSCGTTAGSDCCPPDAAQATARCIGDPHLECQYDAESAVSGTCIECGSKGKLPCYWGCDPGLDLRNRLCDVCGAEFHPPCDRGCNKGLETADGLCRRCGNRGEIPCDKCNTSGCVKACKPPFRIIKGLCDYCGGDGQAPCDSGCDPGLNFINGLCRPCGWTGQIPCTDGKCKGSRRVFNGVCTPCGGTGEIPCATGCNYPLKLANGLCQVCGANGQPPCDVGGCIAGLVVTNGRCAPPGPEPPQTCARLKESCVPVQQPGTKCCQDGITPLVCNFSKCEACVPHGEVCRPFGTQICCSPNETCVIDPFSGDAVCDIPEGPSK